MILLNDLKENGIFKIRISLSDAFNEEIKEELYYKELYAGLYIELREMTEKEAFTLASATDKNQHIDIFYQCLIDHNILKNIDDKASKEEVFDLLRSSSGLYMYCYEQWVKSCPLMRRNVKQST